MTTTAQKYDLSTPAPLPREAARRLHAQKETIAEEMRLHMRRLLRMRTEAAVSAPDVVRVRHFSTFLDGKAWWFSGGSKADPAGRTVLLGCAPSLVYAAIDRVLGGPGTALPSTRPPTTIEFEFGMNFLKEVFAGLASALALSPLHLEVAPHQPLSEPLLTYIPDLEEPFARIPWKVKLLDQEHELLLCIARRLLEAAEPKQEAQTSAVRTLSGPVASAPTELVVELARCRLTVEEAAALVKGDVVLFDLPPGAPIEIRLQGKPRFTARLGTHDGHYAVEVVDVIAPENLPTEAAPAANSGTTATAAPAKTPATPAAPVAGTRPAPRTPASKARTTNA